MTPAEARRTKLSAEEQTAAINRVKKWRTDRKRGEAQKLRDDYMRFLMAQPEVKDSIHRAMVDLILYGSATLELPSTHSIFDS